MFVVLWILNFIQKIVCYMVWIAFALILTFAILMFLSSNSFIDGASQVIVENGLATPEQIQGWTMAGKQLWGKFMAYFI